MNISYLLSSSFPYHKLICDDAGPAIAMEYQWHDCLVGSEPALTSDVVVVDNRHHDIEELALLSRWIRNSIKQLFLLRVNDPFIFHRTDPWYQFCAEHATNANVHFLTPYQPTGLLSYWLSNLPRLQFVYAPFTYDESCEVSLDHHNRVRRVAISGNQRRDLYPLRYKMHLASKFSLSRRLFGVSILRHPGYPEKIHAPIHGVMRSGYVRWLSQFVTAFTDSSIYRIELLKYRELAYAGCLPVGDLPWSLIDCPRSAFVEFKGFQDLFRLKTILYDESSVAASAIAYRTFMKGIRCRTLWRSRVKDAILNLL